MSTWTQPSFQASRTLPTGLLPCVPPDLEQGLDAAHPPAPCWLELAHSPFLHANGCLNGRKQERFAWVKAKKCHETRFIEVSFSEFLPTWLEHQSIAFQALQG